MKRQTIYFDNAATSHPKPEEVYRATDAFLRKGGSPGRSAHELAVDASREVFSTRIALAEFFGIKSAERLIFTPGCTQSINMALHGAALKAGDRVFVTALEHNAVMRPLHAMQASRKIEIVQLPYCPGQILSADELESSFKKSKPALCAFLHASNVTGEVLDLQLVAEICARYEVPLLVDAAQSAGCVPTKLDKTTPLTYWCTSGHKGLFGVPGVGLLFVKPGVDISPFVYGGTGSRSDQLEMPSAYPDRLETGTMPGPAIAGLGAGVAYLTKEGSDRIYAHELRLCQRFLDWLAERKNYKVVGTQAKQRTAVVSFGIEGINSSRVAELLDREHGIFVRAGLHCAATAHATLGTTEDGLVRASFSFFNSTEEVDALCHALTEIEKTA